MSDSGSDSAYQREMHRLEEQLLQEALDRVEKEHRRQGKAFGAGKPRSGPWCNACGGLLPDAFGDPHEGVRERKTEFESIRQAAWAGCISCGILAAAISTLAHPEGRSASLHVSDESLPKCPLRIKYHVGASVETHCIELYALPDARTRWDAFGWECRRNVSRDSASPECMSLVRQWLGECDQLHPGCYPGRSELPKRVIYVGGREPWLHISRGEVASYVALSHRWGDHRPLVTEKATLAERTRRIPHGDLPRQFQDAVALTRALGVDYLWVDSLCIVQDDRDDWEAHAPLMGRIYANSYLTVSADDAADSRVAILGARDGRALSHVSIPCPGPNNEAVAVYARKRVDISSVLGLNRHPVVRDVAHRSALSSPPSLLDTRGWTFQERLLAPRTLHYTASELAFECKACLRCECSPVPHGDQYSTSHLFKNQGAAGGQDSNWPSVVESFTNRHLTFQADRLHAIAGVAAAMTPHYSPDDYLFGLWRAELTTNLLWEVPAGERGSRRNGLDYAPTFSWASVTGAVICKSEDYMDKDKWTWAEVVGVDVAGAGANQYGPGAGSVTLRGLVGPARVTRMKATKRGPSVAFPRVLGAHKDGIFRPDCMEVPEVRVGDEVVVIVLLRVDRIKLDSKFRRFSMLHCIVLKAVGGSTATFRRVGRAHFFPSALEIQCWRGSRVADVKII